MDLLGPGLTVETTVTSVREVVTRLDFFNFISYQACRHRLLG